MRIVQCVVCGVEFCASSFSRATMCSIACRAERRRRRRNANRERLNEQRRERRYNESDAQREQRLKSERRRYWANHERIRTVRCIVCGGNFHTAGRARAKLCSDICRAKRLRERQRHYYRSNWKQEYRRRYEAREDVREKRRRYALEYYKAHAEQRREYNRGYDVRASAAREVFLTMIGPCAKKDKYIARRILQELTP